jgi:hypothetical protein
MKKGIIIFCILAIFAIACGGNSVQKQTGRESENIALPDTVNLADLQEKDGNYFWNDKLYTGVAIREYNEEEWDTPGLIYEMKDGAYHGKYIKDGPGWYIKGHYHEGRADGKWEINDHTEKEIQYFVGGKKHGVWEFYSDGDLVTKQLFENDVLVSEQMFYPIAGMYKSVGDETCKITLLIAKDGNDYVFFFNVNGKEYQGKVAVYDDEIVLEGIPWVSNHGDVQGKGVPDGSGEPTFGIEFVRNDGNLVVQNYGNAMNYYEKLSCGGQYITLERR